MTASTHEERDWKMSPRAKPIEIAIDAMFAVVGCAGSYVMRDSPLSLALFSLVAGLSIGKLFWDDFIPQIKISRNAALVAMHVTEQYPHPMTAQSKAHTDLPYVDEAGFLCGTGQNGVRYPMYLLDRIVGDEGDDVRDRAFIVTACNVHDELVAALEAVMDCKTASPLSMTPAERAKLWDAHAKARAALLKSQSNEGALANE